MEDSVDISKVYAVIMAGGKGERFWPLSRQVKPKQMVSFSGDTTMIESTVQRLFPLLPPENILVITNESLLEKMRELLPLPPENIIGEPCRRNTAPCIALATACVRRRCPDALIAVMPADHIIRPIKKFQSTLMQALTTAANGNLITLGVPVTYPATEYGYIDCGAAVGDVFFQVNGFREKPALPDAEKYFQAGSYFWNSGIFVWQAAAITNAIARYLPDLAARLERWAAGADYTVDFAACESISIDYAVMEKADNILVGQLDCDWNDVGNWQSLFKLLPGDEHSNAVHGNTVTLDAEENVIFCDDDTLIGLIGIKKTAIVKSGNGILIYPLKQESRMRELYRKIADEKPDYL